MSIMRANGYETRATRDDCLTVVAGSPGYSTNVPASSASLRSLSLSLGDTIRDKWIDGDQASGTAKEPTGTLWDMHFQLRRDDNDTDNDQCVVGVGRNGTEQISISHVDSTNLITIRVNGAVVATAASATGTTGAFRRYIMRVDQQAGGKVEVFVDGDLSANVVEYTLLAGDITTFGGKPNEFYITGQNNSFIDDIWVIDPGDATGVVDIATTVVASIEPRIFNADGHYTDWSGSVSDINTLPADANQISATATGQASTFDGPDSTQDLVLFVQTKWRTSRVGAVAGTQVQVRNRLDTPGTDKDETITAAAADGNILQPHHVAADLSAWTTALYNDTEFGLVSQA